MTDLVSSLKASTPKRVKDLYRGFLERRSFHNFRATEIRYEAGFGFGRLYHPYVEALKTNNVQLAELLLYDFYTAYEKWIKTLKHERQAMNVQIWKHDRNKLIDIQAHTGLRIGHFASGSSKPRDEAQTKASHLYAIKESIEKHGYDEMRFGSPLKGIFVENKVLLLGGQHRAAILYSMGIENFKVKIGPHGRIPAKLKLSAKLPHLDVVDAGLLSEADAQTILGRVHSGVSQEQAKSLGYPFYEAS